MGISDLLEQFTGPMGVMKVCQAIDEGKAGELPEPDVLNFIHNVLRPLKNRIDEIVARPNMAGILEGKAMLWHDARLRDFDPSHACEDDLTHLLGIALLRATGSPLLFTRLSDAQRFIYGLYGSQVILRSACDSYADADADERVGQWINDAIAIGMMTWDGGRRFALRPQAEAASRARDWLLRHPEGQGVIKRDGYQYESRAKPKKKER